MLNTEITFNLKPWQKRILRRLAIALILLLATALSGHVANAATTFYPTESVYIMYNVTHSSPAAACNYGANSYYGGAVTLTSVNTNSCTYQVIANGQSLTDSFTTSVGCTPPKVLTTDNTQCVLVSPDCTPPQVLNPTTNQCETPPVTCTNGLVVSSGYYDIGLTPTTNFNNAPCIGGCGATFEGEVPASRAMVNGKYHYYAKGSYVQNTFTCTESPENESLPSSAGLPNPTCASGQAGGTINGKFVCIDQSDGTIANPNTESTDSTTTENTVSNPDGSTTTTTTTTNSDGSKSTSITVTAPDGSKTTTTTSQQGTTDNPATRTDGKTQTAKDVEDGTKEGLKGFCQENPDSPICKQVDSGEAVNTDGLYEGDSQPSFEASLQKFKNDLDDAPFYSMATGFFSVSNPSGSCSGLDLTIEWGDTSFTFPLTDVFCSDIADTIYSILGIGMKLAASYIAFYIAFLI